MTTTLDAKDVARSDVHGTDFRIQRLFHAPRAAVYAAWTDPVQFARWWGPYTFHSVDCMLDVRPGGRWKVTMRGDDGVDFPLSGEFREVVKNERIVMTMSTRGHPDSFHQDFARHAGKAHVDAMELVAHVTFEDVDGGTRLTVVQRFATPAEAAANEKLGAAEGWGMSYERLASVLAETHRGPTDIVVTQDVKASQAAVFAAWHDPEGLDQWWGPDGFSTKTSSMDFRVGGEWRYEMSHAQYGVFPNRQRYVEIVAPERVVYDHDSGVDGDPHGFRTSVWFERLGPKLTRVHHRTTLKDAAELERVKAFGAEQGGQQTLRKGARFVERTTGA